MRPLYALAATMLFVGGATADDADTADAMSADNAFAYSFHAQATSLYAVDGELYEGPTFEEGDTVSLADYAGHPILVVNTAAHCGFTPQFEGLQAVWDAYREDGLMMIGVHQNNFRDQGGTEAELAEQCELYNVDFPQMQQVDVIGEDSDPFYAWVREEIGTDNFPEWNFNKVLIGADGELLATFNSGDFENRSNVKPELIEAIEAALTNT